MGEPRTRADSRPTPRRTLRKVTAPGPSKDNLSRCEVPNGTETDRYCRLLSERRKSGAKGHHLGAKLVGTKAGNGRDVLYWYILVPFRALLKPARAFVGSSW